MSGSCHLDRASNIEIGVECQICVIVIFFNCAWVLKFGAHSRYYKGALTQKRSFLVLCTTFRSDFYVNWKNQNKHSTLNSTFNALSKWHEPDIRRILGKSAKPRASCIQVATILYGMEQHLHHLSTPVFYLTKNVILKQNALDVFLGNLIAKSVVLIN